MVNTRAEKVAKVAEFIPEQTVVGDQSGDLLVVGWGGTYGHLLSAVEELRAEGKSVSLCHVNYINPLPKNMEQVLSNFKKIVVCELNMGQFANYLKQTFQQFHYHQINKTEGLPFTVVELKEKMSEILSE